MLNLSPQGKTLVGKANSTGSAGFTLVELMIVISIISILTAVAYPIYDGYLIRARYMAVLAESSAHRDAVMERFSQGEDADYQAVFGPAGGVTELCEKPFLQIPKPNGTLDLIVIGCDSIRGWSQGSRPGRIWMYGKVDVSGSVSWYCSYGVDGVPYKYVKHAPKQCTAGGGTPDQ